MADSGADEYDAIVIGAGPAGEVSAGQLAEGGLSVALIERDLVGGECSYYACMPSKALLRPGQLLAEAKRTAGVREALQGGLRVDSVLARRDEIVHDLDDSGQLAWLEERGIELIRGHGRIAGERLVDVAGRALRARRAVILATGSVAALPPIPGLREAQPWTNREVTTAAAVPASLLILGGGVVGVEMASAYASLGAEVTLLEAGERLIAGEEELASKLVLEGLEQAGVKVLLGTSVTKVIPGAEVELEHEGGSSVRGQTLLVATGRRPLSEDIGLERIGLEPSGFIEVQDTMQVPGHDWLYALGDLNGRALLTHMGKYQARMAAARILGRQGAHAPGTGVVPRVIFTEPQVAAVGHTSESARRAGIETQIVSHSLQANAGSSFIGHDAGGSAVLVADRSRGVLVGASFVGVEVAESLHAATVAIVGEVPLERLNDAVPSFPTRSEIWLGLLAKLA